MARSLMYDPGTTEARSPWLAGLTEICNKMSGILDMQTDSFEDLTLPELYISEEDRYRIYQAPLGNKMWLQTPTPVIKKNGITIFPSIDGFEIDYLGGSIAFNDEYICTEEDVITASATYIIDKSNTITAFSQKINEIALKAGSFLGSFATLNDLRTKTPVGESGNYAIVQDENTIYVWNDNENDWVDIYKTTDLSNYLDKDQIEELLLHKEDEIPNAPGPSSTQSDYYYSGSKTWVRIYDKILGTALAGLATLDASQIKATDTLLVALGKLQAQISASLHPIVGTGAPAESLSGTIGQDYVDKSNGNKYHLVRIDGTKYIWEPYVKPSELTTLETKVTEIANKSGVTSFKGRTGAVTPASGDYTAAQVGAVPTTRKVNGKPLSADISLNAADVDAAAVADVEAINIRLNANYIALANGASASTANAVALGRNAKANSTSSIAIGNQSNSVYNYTIAIGYNANASAQDAMAIGYQAIANVASGVAIGTYANAVATNATALGRSTNATGEYSTTIGAFSNAKGANSSALGDYSLASGDHSSALGSRTNASSGYATVLGAYANVSGNHATAIGAGENYAVSANARGNESVAIGYSSMANGGSSIAIGYGSNSPGANSVAIGASAVASTHAVALGISATATSSGTIAIGSGANANSSTSGSIAIGRNSLSNSAGTVAVGECAAANNSWASAFGRSSAASGVQSVAVGYGTRASNSYSTAVGTFANAAGDYAIAIGGGSSPAANNTAAKAYNEGSIAIGFNATVNATSSIAIGRSAFATSSSAIAIGTGSTAVDVTSLSIGWMANSNGTDSVAIGSQSTTYDSYDVSIGHSVTSQGVGSIAIGYLSKTNAADSIAIGRSANCANSQGIAIGANTVSTGAGYSIAIGQNASATGPMGGHVVIGSNAKASGTFATALGASTISSGTQSTALGYGAEVTAAYTIQLGNATSLSSLKARVPLTTGSDERDKADITQIGDGAVQFLRKVNAIRYLRNPRELYIDEPENLSDKDMENKMKYGLCTYDKVSHAKGIKKGERVCVGVIAQEVQKALRDVYGDASYANIVDDNFFDYDPKSIPKGVENQLTVNYSGFIPFIIKAIQELYDMITNPPEMQ